MLFTISGKHMDVPDAVKSYAQNKTGKLPRYYNRINHIEVVLGDSKNGDVSIEIIARAEHSKIFIVKEIGENAYKAIDVAVRKLEGQLRRIKGREHDDK